MQVHSDLAELRRNLLSPSRQPKGAAEYREASLLLLRTHRTSARARACRRAAKESGTAVVQIGTRSPQHPRALLGKQRSALLRRHDLPKIRLLTYKKASVQSWCPQCCRGQGVEVLGSRQYGTAKFSRAHRGWSHLTALLKETSKLFWLGIYFLISSNTTQYYFHLY